MSYVKFWAGFCEIKLNFKILLQRISSKCMKTYVGIKILQKSGVWKVLYGLVTIFAVALPNWHGAAAQLSAVFGRACRGPCYIQTMYVDIWDGFPTEYSFDVCKDQVDYWPNILSVYKWVRRIADRIFSWCMQGSGGSLTKYWFHACRGQVNVQPNIYSVYAGIMLAMMVYVKE